MDKISSLLIKYAKGWLILLFFALDALFMGLLLPNAQAQIQSGGGPGPLDLEIFYTSNAAYEKIAAYGEAGRAFYRTTELTTDILYPIVYTLFFSLLITYLFQRAFDPQSPFQRAHLLPFGAWFFDLLENIGIVTMLTAFPTRLDWLASLTGVITLIKWLFAFGSMLMLIVGLGGLVVKFLRKGK
jgi:hypothetical protein